MPASLKDAAPWDVMEDHVLVDLDVGVMQPPVGSPSSDSGRLPAWEQLTETFSIMMVRARWSKTARLSSDDPVSVVEQQHPTSEGVQVVHAKS